MAVTRQRIVIRLNLVGLVLIAAVASPSAVGANSPNSGPTFDRIVAQAQLITLADVLNVRTNGADTLRVEHIYKGSSGSTLTFGPSLEAVVLEPNTRILIAQDDPRSLDFRGTTVWVVASDGGLSDAGITGQPAKLAGFNAIFDLPPTDATPPGQARTGGQSAALLVLLASLLAFVVVAARPRSARLGRKSPRGLN